MEEKMSLNMVYFTAKVLGPNNLQKISSSEESFKKAVEGLLEFFEPNPEEEYTLEGSQCFRDEREDKVRFSVFIGGDVVLKCIKELSGYSYLTFFSDPTNPFSIQIN